MRQGGENTGQNAGATESLHWPMWLRSRGDRAAWGHGGWVLAPGQWGSEALDGQACCLGGGQRHQQEDVGVGVKGVALPRPHQQGRVLISRLSSLKQEIRVKGCVRPWVCFGQSLVCSPASSVGILGSTVMTPFFPRDEALSLLCARCVALVAWAEPRRRDRRRRKSRSLHCFPGVG